MVEMGFMRQTAGNTLSDHHHHHKKKRERENRNYKFLQKEILKILQEKNHKEQAEIMNSKRIPSCKS
jgi:succinate dehydrogenase/fumarate reductase flavoprotein subunit